MIRVAYKPSFIRQFKKLESDLQDEAFEKIELFKDIKNHNQLKVHKLGGRLSDRYSFSVNYKYRITFNYLSSEEVVFLAVGDHDIYK